MKFGLINSANFFVSLFGGSQIYERLNFAVRGSQMYKSLNFAILIDLGCHRHYHVVLWCTCDADFVSILVVGLFAPGSAEQLCSQIASDLTHAVVKATDMFSQVTLHFCILLSTFVHRLL